MSQDRRAGGAGCWAAGAAGRRGRSGRRRPGWPLAGAGELGECGGERDRLGGVGGQLHGAPQRRAATQLGSPRVFAAGLPILINNRQKNTTRWKEPGCYLCITKCSDLVLICFVTYILWSKTFCARLFTSID